MVIAGGMALPEMIQQGHDILTEATKIKSSGDFKFFSEFASENYDRVEAIYNKRGELLGIPTGLKDLDASLEGNGWQPGKVYCIAARPGIGKTAFAMGRGVVAAKLGKNVAVMSREMTGNDLHFRTLAGETNINSTRIKSGTADDDELGRFMEAIGRTSTLPIAIDDHGSGTIGQMVPKIKRLHREWGIDLLIIDYMQLLDADTGNKKNSNREREVAIISRTLKQLAMELRIPILALSQLNRGVEERADKRPMLKDLRESGAIEQDCDVIMFIYRDDYYNEHSERPGEADLIIAKQRDGKSQETVVVGWISTLTKFVDFRPNREVLDLVESWNR
jgi:replicative DNA helicase